MPSQKRAKLASDKTNQAVKKNTEKPQQKPFKSKKIQ